MKNIFKAAMFTPGHTIRFEGKKTIKWGLNLAFVGNPGVGKTRMAMDWTEEFGLHSELIISSIKDPTEFGGLPVPTEDGTLKYIPGPKIMNLINSGHGVGLLDEFNTSAPAVQAAELTMVQDNLAGDIEIPGGIRWVVMMNPTEIAANGHDLSPPMANRFGWITWNPTNASDWCSWLMGMGGKELNDNSKLNAAEEEKRVLANWTKPFAMARGLISAFIKANPGKLFVMPQALDPKASKAWPSPRSWENATRAMASANVHGLEQVERETFISAFVGTAAANELFTFQEKQDLPDPELLLTGKIPFKLDKKRIDRMYAIFNACTAFVTASETKNKKDMAEALWGFCEEAMDRPDLIMDPASTLANEKLIVGKSARNVLKKINPVLVSTGVIPGA